MAALPARDRWERQLDTAWQARHRDPDGCLERGEQLRDEATAAGDLARRGRSLVLVGACHVLRSDHRAAMRALLEATTLLADGPPLARAHALSQLGHLESAIIDPATGLSHLREALELFEAENDDAGQAETLNRIGVAFFSHGDLADARDAYERSLALTRDEDRLRAAGLRNNLAKILTALGELEAAMASLDAAWEGFAASGERRGLGMVLHNMAEVSLRRDEVDRAIRLLGRAIDLYDASAHVAGASEARTRLGSTLMRERRPDEATAVLRTARDQAASAELADQRAAAAEALAEALELTGADDEALALLREVLALERRRDREASDQRLRALQVRFQVERLERDSITDLLTGLRNRRGLDRGLQELLRAAREERDELSVVLLDLDDFKQVNEQHGHSVGDDVLAAVGAVLREAADADAMLGRFGGEEVLVALPGRDRATAARSAVRLRQAIADHAWSRIVPGLAVTASAGVAAISELPSHEREARRLLELADRRLFVAKSEGKDRVRATA